jgi:hypothetical protein
MSVCVYVRISGVCVRARACSYVLCVNVCACVCVLSVCIYRAYTKEWCGFKSE